jgi:hypothetical protein
VTKWALLEIVWVNQTFFITKEQRYKGTKKLHEGEIGDISFHQLPLNLCSFVMKKASLPTVITVVPLNAKQGMLPSLK